MAIPLIRRLSWARLKEKTKRRLMKATRGKALYMITKEARQEIGLITSEMMREVAGTADNATIREAFAERVSEHFERLRLERVPARELGERMVQDLSEMRDLIAETDPNRKALLKNLQRKPLDSVLNEMRQRAVEQRQFEAAQAAQQAQQRRKTA